VYVLGGVSATSLLLFPSNTIISWLGKYVLKVEKKCITQDRKEESCDVRGMVGGVTVMWALDGRGAQGRAVRRGGEEDG
jgi:hypothetical protein